MCLHASRPTSLSSIVGVVCLVVHDQSVVHEVEAVRPGLVRALHHLTHCNTKARHHTVSSFTLLTLRHWHMRSSQWVCQLIHSLLRKIIQDDLTQHQLFCTCYYCPAVIHIPFVGEQNLLKTKKEKQRTEVTVLVVSSSSAQVRIMLMSSTATYFRIKFPLCVSPQSSISLLSPAAATPLSK